MLGGYRLLQGVKNEQLAKLTNLLLEICLKTQKILLCLKG